MSAAFTKKILMEMSLHENITWRHMNKGIINEGDSSKIKGEI